MSTDTFGKAEEYWVNLRPHKPGCTCAPDGYHCEWAQAVAEDTAERQAARYPYDQEAGW